jgi:uncharacterized protein (TIGR02145 family)
MQKKLIFLLLCLVFQFSFFIIKAQTIDNVIASIKDQDIKVSYDLKNAQQGQTFDIELWFSVDNGPYKKCQTINCSDGSYSGISAGNNKNITWIVLQDMNSLDCNTLDFEIRASLSQFPNVPGGASGTFTDSRDKHQYKWVQIGSQTFMAENLVYKPVRGKYWAYQDNKENIAVYGYLYDWETAKKVCPTGWHLPEKEEFETLLQNYGGGGSNAYSCLIPGGSSGFSAIMGGQRFYAGNSLQMGALAYFWSSSNYNSDDGCDLYIFSGHTNAGIGHYNKGSGFSVRCFKD